MAISQINDFREEARDLAGVLAGLDEADWERATAFKQWTINDVVQHLHFSDGMALLSATDTEAYVKLRDEVRGARAVGATLLQFTRKRIGHIRGRHLFEVWSGDVERLCDALAEMAPDERLVWSGPDMGVRMFTTARQMETWAHGQEIYDVLGLERENTNRIKNIAVIGVKTYGWTFANRGLDPPGEPPYVDLTSPTGEAWSWNTPDEANVVRGSAVEFCQVVTQVRNIADTALDVRGRPATEWMAVAQCFAGPPENPPGAGTRVPKR